MQNKIDRIASLIDKKKGENIQIFDMGSKGYFVDNVIIATTLSDRHGYALLDEIKKELKLYDEELYGVEEGDEWIVLDLGDTLIHLMSSEYRAKYNIEEFLDNYELERLYAEEDEM